MPRLSRHFLLQILNNYRIFLFGANAPSFPGTPHSQGFYITHDAPQSVGLPWTSDQLVAENSDNTQHSEQTNNHAPVGFEPTISAADRPQTYALDRAANGADNY